MKIFTIAVLFVISAFSSLLAQPTITFEPAGNGATWTWNVFENVANPPLEFVANPNPSGINTSSTVAKFNAKLGGAPWAGTETAHGQIPTFTFSVSNSTVKIMVYKTVISDVGLKFAESNGEAQPEVKVANTKINEWEELTFDLSGSIGKGITGIIDQVIVFPDFTTRAQDNIIYFDNITFSAQGALPPTGPTVAAPIPTTAAANVISVFSGAYTNAAGTDFNPNWGQGTVATQVDVAGNNTLKYANLNYQGTQFATGLNVTGMTTLHVDFWTANSTALNLYLISPGPVEKAYPLAITQNQWVSVDIPLTAFTSPNVDLSNVIQFKFDGNGTIYLDNLYFRTGAVGGGGTSDYNLVWSDEFSGSGAPAADHWFRQTQLPTPGGWYGGEEQHYTNRNENSYVANGNLNIVAIKESFTDQGQTKQYTSTRLNSKYAFTYGRVDVRAKVAAGVGTLPAIWMLGKNINEPGAYFASQFGTTAWPATGEIDIMEHWGNNLNVIHGSIHTPSSFGGTVNTNTTTVSQATTAFHVYSMIWDADQIQFLVDDVAYYTYRPAVKDATTWPFDQPQYLLLNIAMGGGGGAIDPAFTSSTMEVDYVRVSQKNGIPTEPLVAAPVPTTNAAEVISIFSDTYTNVAGTNLNPGWGQATVTTEVPVAANNTLKLAGLNYQGIELGSPQDVSGKTTLHVDYWTADATALQVFLISPGPVEKNYDFTVTKNAWVSVDIPLTAFAGPALNNIFQLKFVGNGTVYLDNLYFSGTGGGGLTPMNLPVSFDVATVDYGLAGFGGADASTVETDPTLPSNKVAKVIKSSTAETWAGTTITAAANLGFSSKIPFAAGSTKMNVRVYSPHAPIQVRLKVEDHADNTKTVETEATLTTANTWQTLEFDFANQASGTAALNLAFNYDKASIFFNFGVTGATAGERIYYFDDVQFGAVGGGSTLPVLPLDFESTTLNYTFTDFDGGAMTKVANPQSNGINTSANVAKMVKGAGQPWGGSWISLAAPIDFSVNKTFKAKVYSPRIGAKVLLKVENATNAAVNFEKETLTTVANAWEDMTFDYSAINTANQYQHIVLIFDNGTAGDGSANFTFLIDDIRLVPSAGGGLTQMNLPVTFEGSAIDYGLVGFGGADQSTIVVDPVDAANKAAKVIKTNTAETWAGTTVTAASGLGFSSKIPFAAGSTKMNVRVYSPHAPIQVRLKVEDHADNTKSVETEATITTANTWQTLEFNFANQAAGTAALNLAFNYDKASIFFNFGTAGATAGERIYYFDDLQFGAAGGGSTLPVLPLDFESPTLNYTFTDFDGGATTKVANPQSNGINTSANVAKMVKGAGQTWGGSWISLAAPIDFSVNKTFKAKVYSPRIGAKVLLKVENATNAAVNFEKQTLTTVANAWEDMTFDYSAINTANQYQHIVLIFDNGTAGDGSANFTFLIDDIRLVPSAGGGLTQMNLPVTFEGSTIDYGLVGFGGADLSTVVVDPVDAANKAAKVIKTNTAETWAGTTVTTAAGLGFSSKIPFAAGSTKMNVRVYSPHAPIQVRLKVEDHADNGKTVETEATITTANTWQTLEFNFANQAAGTAALNLAFNYDKASIFFNFGVAGATAGERIYYFDDVKFGAAVVAASPQTITFPVIADKTLGGAAFNLTATASSGLAVTYSTTSDKVTLAGSQVTMVKAGRVSITANQAGNASFSAATPVNQSFCIKPAKPVITVSGANTETVTLTSSAAAGNQWFLNSTAITGATNATLTATTLGVYKVQVKVDDCVSDFSAETALIVTGDLKTASSDVTAYPNPADNYLSVRGLKGEIGNAQVYDLTGRASTITLEQADGIHRASVQHLTTGMYILRIQDGNQFHQIKFIKK